MLCCAPHENRLLGCIIVTSVETEMGIPSLQVRTSEQSSSLGRDLHVGPRVQLPDYFRAKHKLNDVTEGIIHMPLEH